MKLDELLQKVEASSIDQWCKLPYATIYGWEYGTKQNVPFLEPKYHDYLVIFKEDIDISLVFGAINTRDYAEAWVNKFANNHADSVAVVLQHNGSPVYEWTFVYVDGGRYLLPQPSISQQGGFEFKKANLPFANLMFALGSIGGGVIVNVEDALKQAGIPIV